MKQRHLEVTLYDYITGRMSEKDRHSAEEHLKECEECQREVNELKRTITLVDQFQPPPLTMEFREKAIQRIRELTLPPKPLFQRIKEWMQIPYVKWPLEGVAVAAVILLALTIYRDFTPQRLQEMEKTPREFTICLPEVKNPIVIETDNLDTTFTQLENLIKIHNGSLVKSKRMEKEIEVSLKVEKSEEGKLLHELNQLGKVKMGEEGYKDGEGNIVVCLKNKSL
jgi:hypothetical protein